MYEEMEIYGVSLYWDKALKQYLVDPCHLCELELTKIAAILEWCKVHKGMHSPLLFQPAEAEQFIKRNTGSIGNNGKARDQRPKHKYGWLYFLETTDGLTKIGITTSLKTRIPGIQSGLPMESRLVWSFETDYSVKLEAWVHEFFEDKQVRGEWFDLKGIQLAYIQKTVKDCDFSITSQSTQGNR